MQLEEAVKMRILELCKERNITVNKLANLSGVYQSTINNVLLGFSKSPKLTTLNNICFGLGIKLKDFFDSPIFDELEDK